MSGSGAWPVRIEDVRELAAPLGQELAERLAAGEVPLSILCVPADPRALRTATMWQRTRGDQVLVLTGSRVITGAAAPPVGAPRWAAIGYGRVAAWSVTESLLYGRLDVHGVDDAGGPAHAAFEFNTVGRPLVEDALGPLERGVLDRARVPNSGLLALPDVPGLPLKFESYLARTLIPEESVRLTLFEPAVVRKAFLRIRLLRPAQLFAATDARLVVIREEKQRARADYGHSQTTIPRTTIEDVRILEQDTSLQITLRSLPEALRIDAGPEHRSQIEALLSRVMYVEAAAIHAEARAAE